MAGYAQQRVYWAKTVVSGLNRFSRQGGKFLDRGGEWQEQKAWAPPGWRFVVWFDAGDMEAVGNGATRRRSWPQHRACYECVADPAASTSLKGTGKRQRGFVEGAFRVVRGEVGEGAGALMGRIKREWGNRAGTAAGGAEQRSQGAQRS
jgi:hypothetical protein